MESSLAILCYTQAMLTKLKLDNVRRKPILIDIFPGIGRNTGTAVYPYVYLSRSLYRDAMSGNPNPYTIGLILHEHEHLARIKRAGVINWYVRYFLSPKFRLNEELKATVPQFAHIKRSGLTISFEKRARLLSGWMYLWAGNYKATVTKLARIWETC